MGYGCNPVGRARAQHAQGPDSDSSALHKPGMVRYSLILSLRKTWGLEVQRHPGYIESLSQAGVHENLSSKKSKK